MGNPLDVCGIYTVRLNICRSSRRTLVCVKRVKNERKEEKETTLARRGPIVTWLHLSTRKTPSVVTRELASWLRTKMIHVTAAARPRPFSRTLGSPVCINKFHLPAEDTRRGECLRCAQSLGSPHFSFSHILSSVISLTFSLLRIQQHVHFKTSIIQASSYIYILTCFDPFDLNIQSYICINWQVF